MINDKVNFLILLLFLGLLTKTNVAPCVTPVQQPEFVQANPTYFDRFYISGLTKTIFVEGVRKEIVTAVKIIHRKITSRIFTYHNLREIYIFRMDLQLFYGLDEPVQLGRNIRQIFEEELERRIFSDESGGKNPHEEGDSKPDQEKAILTRCLVKEMSLSLHFGNEKRVKIFSDNAVVNLPNKNIVFENITISDSYDTHWKGSYAVWADKFNGFLFPKGYSYINDSNETNPEGFFVVSSKGQIVKQNSIPQVDVGIDFVGKIEQKIDKLFKLHIGLPQSKN